MRILLDSRDLIDLVEHSRPIPAQDFDAYLRSGAHEIVLSFTNVRELSSPLAMGAEFLRIRPLLQCLERFPHSCMKEVTIVAAEIHSAVSAFNAGTEYEDCSPYVSRWDHTLSTPPGQLGSPTDNWINFRLDDIIYLINRTNPRVFSPPSQHLPALREQFQKDRAALRAGQAPARQHFIESIKRHATTHRVALPSGHEDEFAEWVYQNPKRCPGLRLAHETLRAILANYADIPETGDFSDLAHIYAVPYAGATTMDRRMRHYCSVASRKMVRFGSQVNYADRLYDDIATLMRLNP
jgi:hypothetical protein